MVVQKHQVTCFVGKVDKIQQQSAMVGKHFSHEEKQTFNITPKVE